MLKHNLHAYKKPVARRGEIWKELRTDRGDQRGANGSFFAMAGKHQRHRELVGDNPREYGILSESVSRSDQLAVCSPGGLSYQTVTVCQLVCDAFQQRSRHVSGSEVLW